MDGPVAPKKEFYGTLWVAKLKQCSLECLFDRFVICTLLTQSHNICTAGFVGPVVLADHSDGLDPYAIAVRLDGTVSLKVVGPFNDRDVCHWLHGTVRVIITLVIPVIVSTTKLPSHSTVGKRRVRRDLSIL